MVKIGVVGVGIFGTNHLHALAEARKEGVAEAAAAAEVNEERRERAGREFGVRTYASHEEMLAREELDAVTVATPDDAHREATLAALAAGKHVLVEKPMEVSVEGCREMVEAAEAGGLLLQVDFHKRYDPYHQELERARREGKLGEVLYGYCHVEDRIEVPRDWLREWAGRSSPIWFLGVHFFDLARWVLGCEAEWVFARGQRKKLVGLGIDTLDSAQAQVGFEGGAVLSFDMSWILPEQFEAVVNQGIRLVGTEGVMEVDSQDRGARSCFASGGMQTYNLGFMRETADHRGRAVWQGYGIESIVDFARNVGFVKAGGKIGELRGPAAMGEDGLAVTKIACAAEESIRTGGVVKLD